MATSLQNPAEPTARIRTIIIADARLPIGKIIEFAGIHLEATTKNIAFVIDPTTPTTRNILTEQGLRILEGIDFATEIAPENGNNPSAHPIYLIDQPKLGAGTATIAQINCLKGEIFHAVPYDLSHHIHEPTTASTP